MGVLPHPTLAFLPYGHLRAEGSPRKPATVSRTMIIIDLHNHTHASHGKNTVAQMVAAAKSRGLAIYGFSEHSPRPLAYSYPTEYRDRLTRLFPKYAEEVLHYKHNDPDLKVLFGMELDWFEAETEFMTNAIAEYPFDYIIGGIHFLGTWGFDNTAKDWQEGPERCEEHYAAYYRTMKKMALSGLVNIVAHPDLIKIFTVDTFRSWLEKPGSLDLIADALTATRDAGMAMEISSAGLRKPCGEIYPGPKIMALARDLDVPITFGSDAHDDQTPAHAFDQLAAYARSYGYTHSLLFEKGEKQEIAF